MDANIEKIQAAGGFLRDRAGFVPEAALVLGSGWGDLIRDVEVSSQVPYADVPGMAISTVAGHAGKWIFGVVNRRKVAIMSGRLHYYEGWTLGQVTFPIRALQFMGVKTLVLTNASGAVNKSYTAGDLMLISDHINLSGNNPLIGPGDPALGARFPDMSAVYDPALRATARRVAADQAFPIHEGVYACMTGPSFETPAEIRMLRALGADAVGMSTVHEAIVARQAGMRVLGLSCLTNMAAGILAQPLTHQEVLDTANRVSGPYRDFLFELIGRL